MHAACCVCPVSADSRIGLQSSVRADSRERVGAVFGKQSILQEMLYTETALLLHPGTGMALLEATEGYFLAGLCAL